MTRKHQSANARRAAAALRKHEAEQEAIRAQENFAGLLNLVEAGAIVHRTPRHLGLLIRRGQLRAIRAGTSKTSSWWVSPTELSRMFPPSKRRPWKKTTLTTTQQHAVIGDDHSVVTDAREMLDVRNDLRRQNGQSEELPIA